MRALVIEQQQRMHDADRIGLLLYLAALSVLESRETNRLLREQAAIAKEAGNA